MANSNRAVYITIYKQIGSAALPNVTDCTHDPTFAKFNRARGLDKCRVSQAASRTPRSNAINLKSQNVPEPFLSMFHPHKPFPKYQSVNILPVLKWQVAKMFLLKHAVFVSAVSATYWSLRSSNMGYVYNLISLTVENGVRENRRYVYRVEGVRRKSYKGRALGK